MCILLEHRCCPRRKASGPACTAAQRQLRRWCLVCPRLPTQQQSQSSQLPKACHRPALAAKQQRWQRPPPQLPLHLAWAEQAVAAAGQQSARRQRHLTCTALGANMRLHSTTRQAGTWLNSCWRYRAACRSYSSRPSSSSSWRHVWRPCKASAMQCHSFLLCMRQRQHQQQHHACGDGARHRARAAGHPARQRLQLLHPQAAAAASAAAAGGPALLPALLLLPGVQSRAPQPLQHRRHAGAGRHACCWSRRYWAMSGWMASRSRSRPSWLSGLGSCSIVRCPPPQQPAVLQLLPVHPRTQTVAAAARSST